jgi:hypothetical protein
MNLGESMKYVLKHRSQNIFSEFWQEDLKTMIKDMGRDFWQLASQRRRQSRTAGFGESYAEMRASTSEVFSILRLVPQRVYQAFSYFREDLLAELEKLPDHKQKTIFSLKVLGSLSQFILSTFYGIRKSQAGFAIKGLKTRNVFTQFLVAELIIRISQLFILRFLSEVEKEVDDAEALSHVKYFKTIFRTSSREAWDGDEAGSDLLAPERAVEIVESFKNYIATGER